MIRPPYPLTERTQRQREFQCVDKNVQTIRVLCFWNRPKAPRSCCPHPCLHQMVAGSAIAASHLRCPAWLPGGCGCLPLKDCTFLPGILSVSCSKNDSVHQLPARNTSLSYQFWMDLNGPMMRPSLGNRCEWAQPRSLGLWLWGNKAFAYTGVAVLKSQELPANSNKKSTARLYLYKYTFIASSAETCGLECWNVEAFEVNKKKHTMPPLERELKGTESSNVWTKMSRLYVSFVSEIGPKLLVRVVFTLVFPRWSLGLRLLRLIFGVALRVSACHQKNTHSYQQGILSVPCSQNDSYITCQQERNCYQF